MVKKGFFAVLVASLILGTSISGTPAAASMNATANLMAVHRSKADIVGGKANYERAVFDRLTLRLRGKVVPSGGLGFDECQNALNNANGELTIRDGSYSYGNDSGFVDVHDEDKTFPWALADFWVWGSNPGFRFLYKPVDENSRHPIAFKSASGGPSLEEGLGGKTVVWKIPDLEIQGQGTLPNYRSTQEQLAHHVPYVELKKNGANISGVTWRIVRPTDTAQPLSLPEAQQVEVVFSCLQKGEERQYDDLKDFNASQPLQGELNFSPLPEGECREIRISVAWGAGSSNGLKGAYSWEFSLHEPSGGELPDPAPSPDPTPQPEPQPAPEPIGPVSPVLPGGTSGDVESVVTQPASVPKDAPIEVQNQAKEEAAKAFSPTSNITSADLAIDTKNGTVTLSKEAAQTAAEKALKRKVSGDINPLPVLQGNLKKGSGGIAALGLEVTDSILMQREPSKIQLLKVTARGQGEMLIYEPDPSKFQDGCFTVLDANGTVVKNLEPGKKYVLSLFIQDGGKYDLNGKEDGKVVDPVAVLSEKTQTPKPEQKSGEKSSGGGCDMGCGLFGLALAVLALRKIRR